MRAVAGQPCTVTVEMTVGDEVAAFSTAPTVTVTSDVGVVYTAPTATLGAYGWSATFTPTDVDHLVVKFSGTSSGGFVSTASKDVQVVGSRYFTIPELRRRADMADTGRYPTPLLAEARDWIEQLIETTCTTSFVERFAQDRITANAAHHRPDVGRVLRLNTDWPSRLIKFTIDGATASNTGLVCDRRGFLWSSSWVSTWVGWDFVVSYSAGYTLRCPDDLHDAAIQAARFWLLQRASSGIPDRTRSITNEFGNVSLSVAGVNAPTGIPDVDSVILAWRDRSFSPGIS